MVMDITIMDTHITAINKIIMRSNIYYYCFFYLSVTVWITTYQCSAANI